MLNGLAVCSVRAVILKSLDSYRVTAEEVVRRHQPSNQHRGRRVTQCIVAAYVFVTRQI